MRHNLKRVLVEPGQFKVTTRDRCTLETYLGSSVGVALFDSTAQVGGVINLLLPYPLGPTREDDSSRFATTGLPLMLDAIRGRGGRLDALRACVTGGALTGPLETEDMDLGGRTLAEAERFLRSLGIPGARYETGGYHSSRMTLNALDWNCTIEPLVPPPTNVNEPARVVGIDDIAETLRSLKPIPQIALKILGMLEGGDYNMEAVAAEVRQDQVIAAKVLKQCNSPFFGLRYQVDSIDRALAILGEKNLLKVILAASVENFFPPKTGGYSLVKGGLYLHALAAARLTERLASKRTQVPPDVAYTAGLLHDLGKVVLDQHMSDYLPFFYRETHLEGRPLMDLELEVMGVDHTTVGGWLAQAWHFPENLKEAITFHHNPEQAPQFPLLVNLVNLADFILSRFAPGVILDGVENEAVAETISRSGFQLSDFHFMVEAIPQNIMSDTEN